MTEIIPDSSTCATGEKAFEDYEGFLNTLLEKDLHDFSRVILDSLHFPILIVEENARIVDCNRAAAELLAKDRKLILHQHPGEALKCIHSTNVTEGCGKGAACADCTIRACVNKALRSQCCIQQKALFEMASDGQTRQIEFLVKTSPLEYAGHKYAMLVMEDLSAIKALLE